MKFNKTLNWAWIKEKSFPRSTSFSEHRSAGVVKSPAGSVPASVLGLAPQTVVIYFNIFIDTLNTNI